MSTPNPLIPQGTFQAQAAKGASNVRLAVATIVAIHIVFFGGLLLQGCKREPQASATPPPETNTPTSALSLGPVESTNFYNQGGLPPDSSLYTAAPAQGSNATTAAPSDFGAASAQGLTSNQSSNTEALWQSDNLSTPGTAGSSLTTSTQSSGPTKEYTIAKGDTLGLIAKRNGVSLTALRKANPNVEPTRIRPGQKIQIPAAEAGQSAANGSSNSSGSASGGNTYTVKSGDTLTRIARAHGITVSQLRAANGMKTSRVNVGQKLKIPSGTNSQAAAPVSNAPQQLPSTGF